MTYIYKVSPVPPTLYGTVMSLLVQCHVCQYCINISFVVIYGMHVQPNHVVLFLGPYIATIVWRFLLGLIIGPREYITVNYVSSYLDIVYVDDFEFVPLNRCYLLHICIHIS